jgi:hypothetical protein
MRRGLGIGKGKGYYNIIPQDSFIHELSRRGISSNTVYKLPIQTAIIVPSTSKNNKNHSVRITPSEFQERLKETRTKMSEMFDGFTSVSSVGEFTNDKGIKIIEPNNVVVAYTNKDKFAEKKDDFAEYVLKKREEWKQDSIGVIIENDLFFV